MTPRAIRLADALARAGMIHEHRGDYCQSLIDGTFLSKHLEDAANRLHLTDHPTTEEIDVAKDTLRSTAPADLKAKAQDVQRRAWAHPPEHYIAQIETLQQQLSDAIGQRNAREADLREARREIDALRQAQAGA